MERSCDHSTSRAVRRDGDRIPLHVQSGIGRGSDETGPGGSAKPAVGIHGEVEEIRMLSKMKDKLAEMELEPAKIEDQLTGFFTSQARLYTHSLCTCEQVYDHVCI